MIINMNNFKEKECPMTESNCKKYNIDEVSSNKFCNLGCSIECGKFLLKDILIKNVKGYKQLKKEYRELFEIFLSNFYKSKDLDDKKTFEPIEVKLVNNKKEGQYLKFIYSTNKFSKNLNITLVGTWY